MTDEREVDGRRQADAGEDTSRRTVSPEEVVRSYWEQIWHRGHLEALEDLVAEPIKRHTLEGSETISRAELRARLIEVRKAVRFNEVVWDALVQSGTSVWVRLTLRGVSLASSSPMTVTWMAQYRVEQGRIAELWALHQPGVDWSR